MYQFIGKLKLVPAVENCSIIVCKSICNEKSITTVESVCRSHNNNAKLL